MPLSYYDPYWRMKMSEGAMQGRDGLGGAVKNRQSLVGAYNAIMGAGEEFKNKPVRLVLGTGKYKKTKDGGEQEILRESWHHIKIKNGEYHVPYVWSQGPGKPEKVVKVRFRVRKNDKAYERFLGMSRAAISLGSDPMDEAGIKSIWQINNKVHDTLFTMDIMSHVQKGNYWKHDKGLTKSINDPRAMGLKNRLRRLNLHSEFNDLNTLAYGKNWYTGKRWTYDEIISNIGKLNWLPESSKNTFMTRIAERMSNLDWSENLWNRVDFRRLNEIYQEANIESSKWSWLKDVLGRTTLKTPAGHIIDTVYRNKLYDKDIREAYINSGHDSAKKVKDTKTDKEIPNKKYSIWYDIYGPNSIVGKDRFGHDKYMLGNQYTKWTRDKKPDRLYQLHSDTPEFRRLYLEKKVAQAEDFMINDLSDMATLKRIRDAIKDGNIPDERVLEIFRHVEEVKRQSNVRYNKRTELKYEPDLLGERDTKLMKEDKPSAKLEQLQIDNMIENQKRDLGIIQRKGTHTAEDILYDTLLIGSFHTGKKSSIDSYILNNHVKNAEQRRRLNNLEKNMENTSMAMVGFNSNQVSDKAIQLYLKEYSKLYKRAFVEEPTKAEQDKIRKVYGAEGKVTKLTDDSGKIVKGKIIEEADLDPATQKYLNEIHPFIGLENGKVKDPQLREAYYKIKGMLNHMHNSDIVGVNHLFRTVTGKNLNKANTIDILDFARYLEEINSPGYWRKMWNWMTGKKDADIKRVYYWQFPGTVDRRLIAESPALRQMVETVSPYKDSFNNTIMGKSVTPMSPMGKIQGNSAKAVEMYLQQADEEKMSLKRKLAPYIASIPEGDLMHDFAIRTRERGMVQDLHNLRSKDSTQLSSDQMKYEAAYVKVRDQINKVKDKTYRIVVDGEVELLTGKDIIKNINSIYTNTNERMHQMLTGNPREINKWLDISKDVNGKESWAGLDKLRWQWTKYLDKMLSEGKRLPIEDIGIDGIRQISKRIIESFTPTGMRTEKLLREVHRKLEVQSWEETGSFRKEHYWPHMSFDRKKAQIHLERAIDNIMKDPRLDKDAKNRKLANIWTQHRQMTGDLLSLDEMSHNYDAMRQVMVEYAAGQQRRANDILTGQLKKVGSQYSREAHIGGWDRSPEAYEAYQKNIVKAFYEQAMQVANKNVINEFTRKGIEVHKKDFDWVNNWADFFSMYAQGAMGYPVHIPERVMKNPAMKVKKTPFKWFADSQTKKRIDAIRKQLGVGRKALKKWKLDEETIDELTGIDYQRLNSWSALEAKYQLASLLAHPKSSIANLYGGSVHTIISTGVKNWRNARNFEYLKTHINPEWRGMEDVERWLQKLGVTEEFLLYEAGYNPQLKSKRVQNFVKEALGKIKKDPNYKDTNLLELKRKHKLTQGMWDVAASFMRVPERMLRRDAFIAHYLQAKARFGNAIKEYDHPFLIEMAKRGVKATQFLYSAPYRPMWTNSALGRVFSRFQLWSWNSVRFRNDVIREARIRGYQKGTPEYERLVRLAQADLFMLGMSNLFMYSLFENALPAPWNWFQDTADWLLGDDKARERAFYGSPFGPVQMITPPALRLLPPLFKGMVHDDYSKLTDYYMWTMLPFGRLTRDIWGPGGAIENPYYSVTKMTGLPILETGELFRGGEEEEDT